VKPKEISGEARDGEDRIPEHELEGEADDGRDGKGEDLPTPTTIVHPPSPDSSEEKLGLS
jgi:hypothetical protein